MIKCLDSGDLYCTICGRLCDDACFTSCGHYRSCSSCSHGDDKNGYCDDCSFTIDKWEDKYIHGGVYK